MAKIGFVGLGHMGLPMAKNLLRVGHHVTGFDVQDSACLALQEAGSQTGASLAETAKDKDVIITMLQTGDQVKSVCFDAKGLFAHASPATLFIDCSSIDVASSREFHQQAHSHQFASLDAPVSGGVVGAEAGSLTFMVGGDESAFMQAEPILKAMGKTIIHTGKDGSGQAAKICNNMILGISMIAISEAFVLAKNLGLSKEKLHEVVTHSSGQCWAMNNYVPVPGILDHVPANHDYQPGFTAAMMLKDLNLSQLSAQRAGIKTPMGELAQSLYQALNDADMAQLDFSAIIRLVEKN